MGTLPEHQLWYSITIIKDSSHGCRPTHFWRCTNQTIRFMQKNDDDADHRDFKSHFQHARSSPDLAEHRQILADQKNTGNILIPDLFLLPYRLVSNSISSDQPQSVMQMMVSNQRSDSLFFNGGGNGIPSPANQIHHDRNKKPPIASMESQ
ncbi:hypothetical protein ACLOJK_035182 [Asimina triloba]